MLAAGLLCGITTRRRSAGWAVAGFLPPGRPRAALPAESWRAAELGGFGLLAGLLVLLLGTVLVARTHSVSTFAAGSAG